MWVLVIYVLLQRTRLKGRASDTEEREKRKKTYLARKRKNQTVLERQCKDQTKTYINIVQGATILTHPL